MKHYNYLALCASIFLSACGGGGGDGDDKSPPARKVGSISGYVYDAPVVGATVTAWEYDNGKIGRHLGVTKTDQHGHYSIPVTSGPRPILITSNGGRYQDPFTRSDIQFVDGFSLSFKSAINYQEGSNATVMVTPLTNISVGLTEYKIKNNINNTSDAITSSNDAVKELYGFDVIETKPVDFVSGGPSKVATPGHEYGMLLTAYSSFASEFPQDEHNRHSSANLANIQYEDIKADGKLDGVGLTEDNTTKRLGFGHVDPKEIPMTQLYTHELAKHIIISANNSEVNLVGLPPNQLTSFSGKVNVLDSPILTGTGVPLDEKPPTVSRDSEQKLYGMDMVALTLRDDVGIDNVGISISYQPAGQSVQQFSCDLDNNESPEFCSLNLTQFTQGKREATIGVRVNTFALDSVSGADLGQAKLIVEAEDTLENEGSKDIEFKWDNSEPQVNILSQDSVQDGEDTYTLRFSVDYLEKIKSAEITFNGGAPTIVDLTCGQNSETKVYTCDYNKAYQTEDIFSGNVAEIVVTATSSVGAKGSDIKTVTRDNNPPNLRVSGSGVEFLFIDNGEKGSNPKGWLPTTYTADTVQDDPTSLWVDYIAGTEGLRAFSGNFGDFSAVSAKDFIEKDINTNTILRQVPYLIAEVEDTGTPKSTPDKINLIVKHSVFRNGAFSAPHVVNAIEGNAVNIPRKKYQEKDQFAYYYIPLSDDILNGVEQNVPNKLEITAKDQATNPSLTKTVFFKMSYDLPEVKVVTPYAGANVQVKDLISGSNIGACTTKKELNAAGDEALNVASCRVELSGDMASVFSVSLSGSATYYYNPEVYGQSNEAPTEITVDLGDKDFTVYFSPEATQTFYINELTVFHSALFESLWQDGQNRTVERAKEILALVQEALQGTDSFFGFDPTRTAYETIEEAQAIRDTNGDSVLTSLSPSQKHRLLAESLAFINGEPSEVNTSTSIARKIYEDLKDGKAHGLPTHGAATYQIIWAQKFQERMVNPQSGSYFVSAPIALQIADQLALAFPKLGETPIFEQQGSSIDQSGPSHNLTITTGKQYQKGANTYIAGQVDVSLTIEDPSGVKASSVQPKWVSLGDDNEKDASIIVNDPTGGTYKKSYNFSLDSTLDQYKNIEKFLLHISAEDFKGYPLDNYIETLVVDNDVPVVTYHLKDSTGANWDTSLEDVFVNPSQFFSLDFSVSDAVGDQPSKRRVSLEHTETRVYAFVDPKMLLNKDASFAIGLCGSKEGEGCNSRPTEREHNFYLQGDGEWNINVEATDYLENGQTKQVGKILLDTTPPIVNSLLNGGKALSTTEKNWLSGDEMLQPSINWQGDKGVTPFSAGERVSVSLNLQGAGTKDLVSCALLDSADEKPCLIGDQPNVKVKLVARAFTQHDTPSTLYISATDKAKPANTSEKTQINVYFDRKGPVLDLQEPWLEDTHVNRSTYVLGKTFHVKLKNIADDSLSNDTPITLELYQYQVEDIDGNKPNDILIKRVSRSNLVDAITVTEIESEKIIPVGDIPSATFYIKATDVEGNYTLSHIASHGSNGTKVLFDKEGPEINLSGYDSMAYYKGDYQFTVNAQDYISLEGNKGAAGIDDDSLTYWLFEEGSSKSGTGTPIVDKRISLNSLTDGVLNLTMTGSDIRGNRHEVTKKINVRNSLPSIELVSIAYADGTDVERPQGNSQHLVTKQGNLEVKIKVEDKSGIDALKGTLLNGENTQIGTLTLKEVEGESNLWAATVDQGVISSDGHYLIKFTASNRVKVNSLGAKEKTETTYPFSVARSGPKLSIVEPIDFATHTSNHNLSVKLALDGTVVPSQMRCWVRNNYTSDIEPRGDEANKNASSLLTNNYQDCEIKSIDTNMDNPSFILWTKGSNGAESVQKWSFKQVDIEAPEYCRTFENNRCVTGSDFNLKNQHVFYDEQSKAKQLKFDLFFSDNLSGILTDDTDDTRFPRLESLNKTITPTSCKKVANQTDENRISCEFGGPYADFIDINNIDQVFKVGNLADLAGNGTDLTIEFKTPDATDGIGVELNVPKYVSGESLVVVYKVKSYAGSKIDDVKVEVDNVTYSRREKPTMFGQAKTCTDDPEKLCQTFTIDTPQNKEGQVVPIKVVVTDFWGESGVSTVESVTIDTTEPTIGDVLTNLTHDNNGKVRLEFAIEDSGSQLSKVKYTAFDQDTEVVKVPFNVLEIPVETLTNTTTMTVKVQAFDDAGNTFIQNVKVNLSVPKIELLLDGISGLNEQKIAIKKSAQAFTLKNTQTASDVTAAKYKIILDSVTPDSQILKEGRFSSQDEKDELTLDLDAQGSYKLRIEVMDSIGRTSDNFTFSGKAFSTEGVLTVVDFLDPVVNNLRIDVSEKPQSNQYEVTVLAEIKDVNFDAATVTLTSTDGPFSKSYPMVKVGTDQDYQLKLQLPVGGYKATVKVVDLVGRETITPATQFEVDEAEAPTVSSIMTESGKRTLGGGVKARFKIVFNEAVQEFVQQDITVTVNDGGDVGSLTQLQTTDRKTWLFDYTTPTDTDKSVRFTIAAGMVKNEVTGVEGPVVAFSEEFAVKNSAPSPTLVELSSELVNTNEQITFNVTFAEKTTMPSTSYLGDSTNKILWETQDSAKKWTGTAIAKATSEDLALAVVISGYRDEFGNEGEVYSEKKILLRPSITINQLEINAGRLTFNGNAGRVGDTATVTLSLLDSQNTQKTVSFEITQSDWSHDIALTTLSELSAGAIRVTAQIENALKASAESVAPAKTFTLDQQAPSLSNADLGAGSASVDEERTVVLTFSEAVTQPTATLGSETVRWTSTGTRQTAWTGEVTVKSADATALSLPFKVSGFTDNSGNPGVESTEHSVVLTPSIAVGNIEINAGRITFNGNAGRVGGTATVTLSLLDSQNTQKTVSFEITQSDWSHDMALTTLSELSAGAIRVTAQIENALKASAESVAPAKTFTLDQQAPSLSNADLGVGSASVDEERTVVLTFSEAVTQPTATLGSETVRWTSTGTRQTAWTGEVTVKSADATALSLPFKVSGFTDNSGNPGVESTEHSVVLTPSIAVGNIEINAGRITFNGNAGRVGGTATVTLSLLDSQNTQKTVSFEITQSDWSHDIALTTLSELSAGAIRVTAQIENALKASAESVAPAKTFTLDQQAPSLSNADLGVGSASVDEERTVVLTFSEAVTQPTATLGSETVRWTSTGTRQTAWTGEVTVKSADATVLSLPFKVSGFTDNSGNPGVESTEHSVVLTPSIAVGNIEINAGRITFNGNAGRVGDTATVTLSLLDSQNTQKTVSFEITQSDWSHDIALTTLSELSSGAIRVTAQIENALKASAESVAPAKTFTLDQQAPSLSNADLGVGSASVDEERTVVLTFSEAVTQPTATLGSETVRWTSTGTRQTAWTGEVTVKSADATVLSLPFKVSGFTDNSGNPGVESTEHSVVLTPSIAVGNIEINAGRLTFNGNAGRVGDTATVTLSLLDSQNTQKTVSFEITQSDWSHDMALTTLSELSAGAIRVTAQIENALKASAESVAPAKTFTLDQQAPSLSNADLGVGSASVDEERTVVLTFSEAVTQPTATLGSETVRWTSTGTRQTAWTGEVTVKSADATALSLPFKVSGFTDNSGNPGVESTEHSVNLQPTLSVLDVDDVSENVAVTIVGKSTGFVDENNISVTLTPPTGNSLVKSVTLDDEGNWTTSPLDVSGFELGKVTVTVKGSNANRIPALDKSIDFNIIN